MKAVPIALAVVLLSFGIVAGVVLGLGDDEVLTQPPEAVAQEFVRAMSLGQTGAAREMLSHDAERRTSAVEVRRISDRFRARLGRLEEVEGTVAHRRRDTATVRIRIEGEQATADRHMALVRESGAWSVARASDILASEDSRPEPSRP
ncbi:MAG TPA: hypothetical protein VJ650_10775 [Gemmatimonadaceae bacterium]|nr:hypothetical protein [Gemmatimonadaceae bacterium]